MASRLKARTAPDPEQRIYTPPCASAKLHTSLIGFWWILEVLPKLTKFREWRRRVSFLGLYFPLAEPRPIPEGALIHGSVFDRIAAVSEYRPINLPDTRVRVG